MKDPTHWSEKSERGSYFALRFLFFLYRAVGKWICKLLLIPTVTYFFLTGHKARAASKKFLTRVWETDPSCFKRRPGNWESFKHFLSFGFASLDRFSAWLGEVKRTEVGWENRHRILDLVEQKKGGLLIGAHLGSLESLRGVVQVASNIKFNALVFIDHAPRFNQLLRIANPDVEVNLISIKEFTPDIGVMLKEKIDQGEFVAILGERSPSGARDRVCRVPFMGHSAPFPVGPMILASLLHCPVFFIFCLRGKRSAYDVYLEPFAEEELVFPRKGREAHIEEAIRKFAHVLEEQCLKAPYQWYNFYDFWYEGYEHAGTDHTGRKPAADDRID